MQLRAVSRREAHVGKHVALGPIHQLGELRIWFGEDIDPVEIAFEADIYLLTKTVAARLKSPEATPIPVPEPTRPQGPVLPEEPGGPAELPTSNHPVLIRVSGNIPPEQWNRLGTRLIPKMQTAGNVDRGDSP